MIALRDKFVRLRGVSDGVPLKELSQLQPVVLLNMLVGLSHVLNQAAAQPEQMARALILDGQQRLRALREVAPQLDLSLGRLVRRVFSEERLIQHCSHEQSAVQAAVEMCIGLLLRWLAQTDAASGWTHSAAPAESPPCFDAYWFHLSSAVHLRFRPRSCLIP